MNTIKEGDTRGQSWFSPQYLGVALLLSWIYLLFYEQSEQLVSFFGITASLSDFEFWGSSFALAATLLLLLPKPAEALSILRRPTLRILTIACICVGTALTLCFVYSLLSRSLLSVEDPIAANYVEAATFFSGSLLTGIGSGILACRWADAYGHLRTGIVFMHAVPLIAVSAAITITAMYLPEQGMQAVLIALPVGSALLLRLCEQIPQLKAHAKCPARTSPSEQSAPENLTRWFLPFMYVCLAVLGFAPTFLGSSPIETGMIYSGVLCMIATCAVLAICVVYIVLFHRGATLLSVGMPIALIVCVLIPSATIPGKSITDAFLPAGYICLEALLFVILIVAGKQARVPVVKTYAVGRLLYVVADIVGFGVTTSIIPDEETFAAVAGGMVGFAGCVVLAFAGFLLLISASRFVTVKDWHPMSIENASKADLCDPLKGSTEYSPTDTESATAGACAKTAADADLPAEQPGSLGAETAKEDPLAAFAQAFSLTEREVDVLSELLRGRTLAHIQGTLHISKGTASYHVQNIYAKCNVHSKQALMDLYEQGR